MLCTYRRSVAGSINRSPGREPGEVSIRINRMYRLAVFCLGLFGLLLAGCNATRVIDRDALDKLYAQTALAEGSASFVPLHVEGGDRPERVVNWFYAGTDRRGHLLVYRELVLDGEKPVGRERRYTIDPSALSIAETFDRTRDRWRWVYLHEAAGEVEPPGDVLTSRRELGGEVRDPVDILPERVDPRRVEPEEAETADP